MKTTQEKTKCHFCSLLLILICQKYYLSKAFSVLSIFLSFSYLTTTMEI